MEEYIYIGKIVNTHGIHGEIRLLSDFDRKEKVFLPGITLYIGRKKEPVVITSYRHHKNFEMVCLEGYNNINEVLHLKGLYAYVKKKDLDLEEGELLENDYLGLEAFFANRCLGKIVDIENRGCGNKILVIDNNGKRILIPFQEVFIDKVSVSLGKVELKNVEGLIS